MAFPPQCRQCGYAQRLLGVPGFPRPVDGWEIPGKEKDPDPPGHGLSSLDSWIATVDTAGGNSFFHGRTSYSSASKREIKPKTQPQRKTNGKSWIFCLIPKLLLNHLKDVVGGTVAPARREAYVPTPGIVHMNVTFFGKRDFADTIKLRIPRQNPPRLLG